jgi:hypothetical protein
MKKQIGLAWERLEGFLRERFHRHVIRISVREKREQPESRDAAKHTSQVTVDVVDVVSFGFDEVSQLIAISSALLAVAHSVQENHAAHRAEGCDLWKIGEVVERDVASLVESLNLLLASEK